MFSNSFSDIKQLENKEKNFEKVSKTNIDKYNKKINNIDNDIEINKEIALYFVFKNGKELYLDAKDSYTFEQVIKQLHEKYLWLKNINIKEYQINAKKILINKKVKENKLVNNSIIYIIE